jgi:hypothetical protein
MMRISTQCGIGHKDKYEYQQQPHKQTWKGDTDNVIVSTNVA